MKLCDLHDLHTVTKPINGEAGNPTKVSVFLNQYLFIVLCYIAFPNLIKFEEIPLTSKA